MGRRTSGPQRVGRVVRGETPKVLADLPDGGDGWTVHYALFGWQSFTEAAQLLARAHGVRLLTLPEMEREMQEA